MVEIDLGLKGDTKGTGGKPAALSTGAAVLVLYLRSNQRSDPYGYSL